MTKQNSSADQLFLDDLDKKLWNAADRLRSHCFAISVYGQGKRTERSFGRAKRARRVRPNFTRPKQSNPTTWRLAAMNIAIRGIDFNFGKQPADTFLSDQHPDLRADYVMANPPFNISEWWDGRLEGDRLGRLLRFMPSRHTMWQTSSI